jgi:hypothetical protein
VASFAAWGPSSTIFAQRFRRRFVRSMHIPDCHPNSSCRLQQSDKLTSVELRIGRESKVLRFSLTAQISQIRRHRQN